MMSPRFQISVVIPTYDRPDTTAAALDSVMAQDLPPREIIIVDDGSRIPFTLPFDLRDDIPVRLVRLEKNSGAGAARNAGVAAATGKWIAFLDSDDVWAADKLSRQVAFAEANPADARTCFVTGFGRVDTVKGARPQNLIPVSGERVEDFAAGCWFAPGSTLLVQHETFHLVGGFDESLRRLEDFDWFLRLAVAGGRVRTAPFVGSLLRIAGRPNPQAVEEARQAIVAKWSGEGGSVLGPSGRRRLSAYLDLECASVNFYDNRPIRACAFLARSLAGAPRLRIPIERWWRIVKSE